MPPDVTVMFLYGEGCGHEGGGCGHEGGWCGLKREGVAMKGEESLTIIPGTHGTTWFPIVTMTCEELQVTCGDVMM